MNLCCSVNPTKQCKTCGNKFCPEHIYQEDSSWTRDVKPIQCHECYRTLVLEPSLAGRKGMTMTDLFLEIRKVCPTGYMTVTVAVQDSSPGLRQYSTEWQIYHEKHKHIKAATPEQVLAAFVAAVKNMPDPQVTPLGNINV